MDHATELVGEPVRLDQDLDAASAATPGPEDPPELGHHERHVPRLRNLVGVMELAGHRRGAAASEFRRAAMFAAMVGDPDQEAVALLHLAAVELDRGHRRTAILAVARARTLLDQPPKEEGERSSFGVATTTAAITGSTLEVDADGRWFEVPNRPRVSLGRAAAPCRILRHLVERHLTTPGRATSWQELFEVGWPGERIAAASGRRRVHTAIWSLRNEGLSGILATRPEGYLFRPDVVVERRDETELTGSSDERR